MRRTQKGVHGSLYMKSSLENQSKQERLYQVVVNHEEQYTIWPLGRGLPLGWRGCEIMGTREECLAFIEKVWVDMRPLSIRIRSQENVAVGTQPQAE